jgi:hypothetical protein
MATKTAVAVTDPAEMSAAELRQKIDDVDLQLAHAASEDATAAIELRMAQGRAVLGDASRLPDAEARKRATEARLTDFNDKRASLVGWEVVARYKAIQVQKREKLAKIAAEKTEYAAEAIALPLLWDEIRKKTEDFERRDREQQRRHNYISAAGTVGVDGDLARLEAQHREVLEAAGVLGRG